MPGVKTVSEGDDTVVAVVVVAAMDDDEAAETEAEASVVACLVSTSAAAATTAVVVADLKEAIPKSISGGCLVTVCVLVDVIAGIVADARKEPDSEK